MDTYAVSLNALVDGMPEAGILTPPNSEIETWMRAIAADWAAVTPLLDKVLDQQPISPEEQITVFRDMNKLTGDMNTVVGLYAESSDLGL